MWIGIDGEGIERNPHRYVLLCASTSSGQVRDYIEDVNGIGTAQALRWLLSLPAAYNGKKGSDVHAAGFYLSYDWTMILKDLPNRAIYRLLRPELRARPRDEGGGFSPVKWQDYSLDYLSGMMRITRGNRRVTVWDVGRFFQCRFVQALEQSGIAAPELIRRMKTERDRFTRDDLDRIRRYCLDECLHLAKLVELLEEQHAAIGLDPRTWYGPGSTASGVLTQRKVIDCHAPLPSEVEQRALESYFGGRFEHRLIGRADRQKGYDVRSAYPHAATTLPCLKHGKWQHRRRTPKQGCVALVKYRVRDIGDRAWGPLPCRLEDDSIVWPRGGSNGWCWSVEFEAAMRHWSGVDYAGEHWELVRKCDCLPFEFLRELYRWRVERPENKQVVKLAINSVYGKLAQSIGGGSKWSSRAWAGIITATCRSRMLDLIGLHGDESRLSAIATDGAYSSEQLDIAGDGFGDWEIGDKGLMTFVRPGIYWSHADILAWYAKPGDRTLEEAAAKAVRSRGLGRRHLLTQIVATEKAITDGVERAELGQTQQFGGARECVYLTQGGEYRRSALYGEWYNTPATLSLAPAPKRDSEWRPPMFGGITSAPYRPNGLDARKLKLIGSMLEGRIR